MSFFHVLLILFLAGTAITLLVTTDWRWSVAALGLQYLAAFSLVVGSWPLESAAVKLVAGWMAGALLGYTQLIGSPPARAARRARSEIVFRILAAGLVLLVVVGAAPGLAAWATPISLAQAWGGLLLIGLGVLHTGLGSGIFARVVGLLTLFAGFEILYAAVEASTLVAGLLGMLNLGVVLVGAYLMQVPDMEPLE